LILCDTNVLVALVDNGDPLSADAQRDLTVLARHGLLVTEPVLCETLHLLEAASHRSRLQHYITLLPIALAPSLESSELFRSIFAWLKRYSEHSPDWADAHLAMLAGTDRRLRVWTYDTEFQTIWRRPDGSKIPVVGKRKR
jgi:predicted nucleic acid-binding protein